ncbi:Hypothetical predicted protein [Marmota monax]|uniref:Uncharacterized protein n=1 Tax=Marmota monax TaxID=9995 RepID=A0A5E4AHC1_MARMO|nr:hypothetical protein GHT09_008975 [Marmota monax]VTJ56843.1 Hypothetical predicted protein [Marmota monax]
MASPGLPPLPGRSLSEEGRRQRGDSQDPSDLQRWVRASPGSPPPASTPCAFPAGREHGALSVDGLGGLALISRTLAPGTSLPVAGTPSLRSQSGPRGHRQQWRRRHGCLRGGLCSALQRDLWLCHFFSREGLCDSRRRRTFQPGAEKPGLKPPRLGFAATSPLRHCACAPGERCALAEPIGTRVLAFTSRGPWTCLHGNLLHPSSGLARQPARF